MMLMPGAGDGALAGDYRYTLQLDHPGTVLRTDPTTGATRRCRLGANGPACAVTAEDCDALLDRIARWQDQQGLPSEAQTIDCLEHGRCGAPKAPPPVSIDIPGLDPDALESCFTPAPRQGRTRR